MKKVNKNVYLVLTLLFGSLGINKFYAGKIKQGILSILFCWTLIPFILSIVEFIVALTEKKDKDGKIDISLPKFCNVRFYTAAIIFVLFILGSIIPWSSLNNKWTLFSDFNTWLSEIKIGKYELFSNLIGPVLKTDQMGSTTGILPAFGNYSMMNISALLFVLTIIIIVFYKVKLDEGIELINNGIKKALPISITAVILMICFVITMVSNNQGGSGIGVTIINGILSLSKSSVLFASILATIVGSIFAPMFTYFANLVGIIFTINITDNNVYGVLGFVLQSLYYLVMIFAPTSIGLVIGLYYLNIPYNKWLKYIWKVLLSLFLLILIISIILIAIV